MSWRLKAFANFLDEIMELQFTSIGVVGSARHREFAGDSIPSQAIVFIAATLASICKGAKMARTNSANIGLIEGAEPQKAHSKNLLTTPLGRFIETRSYRQLLACGAAVLALSTIYFSIAPSDGGLISSVTTKPISTWQDALYFSTFTLASAGYGDLVPVGWGRLMAAFDALSGLGLVALLIGKVASERQYSMLLLLHTSDCQRRISGFVDRLHACSSSLEEAEKSSDKVTIAQQVKLATGLLSAINNYIVFHLNQSRLAEFGNHTSLRSLCEELRNLQKHLAMVFRTDSADGLTEQRCMATVERLYKLGELVVKHHPQDGRAPNSIVVHMKHECADLREWARTHVTEWSVRRVYCELPERPAVDWPSDIHKHVAAKLNISNKLSQKCIDELIERGWVSVHGVQVAEGPSSQRG